ncbi:TlpA family protein disulfide reductase [Enhygromyxa salina]|uniref:TlpA family protein disulfide reductase n=1 Tax=Enhygromyxa salina TaxID=215803 RepID=UPI0011B21D89|nr:hypothetical protein [Enhygromyxa salina]
MVLLGLSVPLVLAGCDSDDGDPTLDSETAANGDTAGEGEGDTADEGEGEDGTDTGGEELGCQAETPYAGGWDIGCCQDEIVPNGWAPGAVNVGTILPDWTFNDQFGDAVRVYDFCHEAIYFDYVALWCGSCQALAPTVSGLFDTYDQRGLMTLTYVSEGADGSPATLADVQAWTNTYNHKGLVVTSGLQDVWYPFGVDTGGGSFSISLPGVILVGPNMKIAKMGEPTIQEIELVIPDAP